METPRFSTDPQDNEKAGNYFRRPFEALAGHTVADDKREPKQILKLSYEQKEEENKIEDA